MADFNLAWKQRIQIGFLYEPVRLQSFSQSVKMEGGGSRRRWPSWKNLKRRIGWKRIDILGFCGSSKWVLDTGAEEEPLIISGDQSPAMSETMNPGSCIGRIPAGGGTTMNLATALAADRRKINVKPLKSIVRLFEEMDGREVKVADDDGDREAGGGVRTLCCHCTRRNKGAALIPCGHTYCRVCSKWMWSKQEACPLCNRSIMDVLEIL